MNRKFRWPKLDVLPVIALFGVAAVIYGLGQLSRPAAFILGGMATLICCILAEAARKRREIEERNR